MPNPDMFNPRGPQNAGIGGFPKMLGFGSGFAAGLNRRRRKSAQAAAQGSAQGSARGGGKSAKDEVKLIRAKGNQERKTIRTTAAASVFSHGEKVRAGTHAINAMGPTLTSGSIGSDGSVTATKKATSARRSSKNSAPAKKATPAPAKKATPAPAKKTAAPKPSMTRKQAETALSKPHPLGDAYVKKTTVSGLSKKERAIHDEHIAARKQAREALKAHDRKAAGK